MGATLITTQAPNHTTCTQTKAILPQKFAIASQRGLSVLSCLQLLQLANQLDIAGRSSAEPLSAGLSLG